MLAHILERLFVQAGLRLRTRIEIDHPQPARAAGDIFAVGQRTQDIAVWSSMRIRRLQPSASIFALHIECPHQNRTLKGHASVLWKFPGTCNIDRCSSVASSRQIRINPRNRLPIEYRRGCRVPKTHQRHPHRRALIDPRLIAPGVEDHQLYSSLTSAAITATCAISAPVIHLIRSSFNSAKSFFRR